MSPSHRLRINVVTQPQFRQIENIFFSGPAPSHVSGKLSQFRLQLKFNEQETIESLQKRALLTYERVTNARADLVGLYDSAFCFVCPDDKVNESVDTNTECYLLIKNPEPSQTSKRTVVDADIASSPATQLKSATPRKMARTITTKSNSNASVNGPSTSGVVANSSNSAVSPVKTTPVPSIPHAETSTLGEMISEQPVLNSVRRVPVHSGAGSTPVSTSSVLATPVSGDLAERPTEGKSTETNPAEGKSLILKPVAAKSTAVKPAVAKPKAKKPVSAKSSVASSSGTSSVPVIAQKSTTPVVQASALEPSSSVSLASVSALEVPVAQDHMGVANSQDPQKSLESVLKEKSSNTGNSGVDCKGSDTSSTTTTLAPGSASTVPTPTQKKTANITNGDDKKASPNKNPANSATKTATRITSKSTLNSLKGSTSISNSSQKNTDSTNVHDEKVSNAKSIPKSITKRTGRNESIPTKTGISQASQNSNPNISTASKKQSTTSTQAKNNSNVPDKDRSSVVNNSKPVRRSSNCGIVNQPKNVESLDETKPAASIPQSASSIIKETGVNSERGKETTSSGTQTTTYSTAPPVVPSPVRPVTEAQQSESNVAAKPAVVRPAVNKNKGKASLSSSSDSDSLSDSDSDSLSDSDSDSDSDYGAEPPSRRAATRARRAQQVSAALANNSGKVVTNLPSVVRPRTVIPSSSSANSTTKITAKGKYPAPSAPSTSSKVSVSKPTLSETTTSDRAGISSAPTDATPTSGFSERKQDDIEPPVTLHRARVPGIGGFEKLSGLHTNVHDVPVDNKELVRDDTQSSNEETESTNSSSEDDDSDSDSDAPPKRKRGLLSSLRSNYNHMMGKNG